MEPVMREGTIIAREMLGKPKLGQPFRLKKDAIAKAYGGQNKPAPAEAAPVDRQRQLVDLFERKSVTSDPFGRD